MPHPSGRLRQCLRPGFRVCLLALLLATGAASAQPDLVAQVRAAIAAADLPGAEQLARRALGKAPRDPEALLALSWVGRGALAAKQWEVALRVARDTEARIVPLLKTRPLDAEPQLPLALGASYEVQAQAMAAQGARTEAVHLLTRAVERYGATSIHARLRKNVHLLSLVGQPALPLATGEFLSGVRAPASVTGRPTLLFFWAHWCSDCKAQAPVLARLQSEFASRGLAVVAPTQRYGYIGAREDVPPADERRHIASVRQEHYPSLAGVPIPLGAQNFTNYGVSTTPTLVLVDARGLVRLYHPGTMTEAALRSAITTTLAN